MNKLYSALGAIVVIALCVIFIVQFQAVGPTSIKSDNGPQCVAEVKGNCISAAWFTASSRLLGMGSEPSQLRAMGFKKRVAEGLIESWALGQDAKRLGIGVSDEDITAEIAAGRAHVSIPAADLDGILGYTLRLDPRVGLVRLIPTKSPKTKKFDAKYAEKQIRNLALMSPTDYREFQRSEILADRMRELIKGRVRISENEAFDEFSREESTVTLDFVRFDRSFYRDLFVDASPRNVQFWADANKEELDKVWDSRKSQIMPECRSVREIYVKLDEAATPDDKAKAKAKIDRAKARIDGGEDFADVARAMSDAPNSVRGGELGCMAKGKNPKPLEDAVAALAPGKMSDVIGGDAGFYLIKLEQVAKDADAEKLGRAQTARELYLAHESERLAVEGAKKVAAAVKGGKSLKEALDLYLAELAKAKEAPAGDKDKKAADGKDAKADGKKDKKGDKDKKDKSGDASKNADDRAPLTMANHPNRPVLETTLPFSVNGDPITGARQHTAEIVKAAFALEKPGDAPADAIPFDSGYLAIQLKEKTPASKEQWEKRREFYVSAMRSKKQHDALAAYVKNLREKVAGDAKVASGLVDDKAPAKGGNGPAPIDDDPGE